MNTVFGGWFFVNNLLLVVMQITPQGLRIGKKLSRFLQ